MTEEEKKLAAAQDEAHEEEMDPEKEARMLLNPPATTESVQFSDGTNGAKITLPSGAVKSGVGMTKAELMKYANDPFWVRLRTFLFILFWVVWFAMLIGAVAIIAFAPGCPATAKLPWWKKCSLMQVSVRNTAANFQENLNEATSELAVVKKNLDQIKRSGFDGYLLSGLNTFYLADHSENSTVEDSIKFKNALIDLVQASHGEDFPGGKLILNLRLAEAPTSQDWYLKSQKNETPYSSYFIWRSEIPSEKNDGLSWEFDPVKLMYFVRRNSGHALLNFASDDAKEAMKQLVVDWVRTRVDGIQADGDFFVDDGKIHPSQDAAATGRKWIKTGGDNKAFLMANSQFSDKLAGEGDDLAAYELSSNGDVWAEFTKSEQPVQALKNIFQGVIDKEHEHGLANKTTKDHAAENAEQTGSHWKTYIVQHSESDKNTFALKYGSAVAEGALSAFFMIPKVTPIVEIEPDQLSKLALNQFLPKLQALRKTHSETMLLGESRMPTVSSSEVFAVHRMFHNQNSLLLLINFSGLSQEITVTADTLPPASTHHAKIIMVDSKSKQELVGTTINFPSFKIDAKQVLLLEFAPIK